MRTITVLLGDPKLPDASKPGGRYTDDDLFQVEKLRAALAAIPEREFDYWNDHTHLFERLREERPDFVLNFCDTGFRNNARHELEAVSKLFAAMLCPEIGDSKAPCAGNGGSISKRGNAASADFRAQPEGPGPFIRISTLVVAR